MLTVAAASLLLLLHLAGAANPPPCQSLSPLFPSILGRGVDLARWSAFPPPREFNQAQVLGFTCSMPNSTWTNPYNGKTYARPDQVKDISTLQSSLAIAGAFSAATSVQYWQNATVSYSSQSCNFLFACSSSSKSESAAVDAMYNASMLVGGAWANEEYFKFELWDTDTGFVHYGLSTEAQLAYDTFIGTTNVVFDGSPASRAPYDKWRSDFGTHFFTSTTLGGFCFLGFEIARETLKAHVQSSITQQGAFSFLNALAAAGHGGTAHSIQAWFSGSAHISAMMCDFLTGPENPGLLHFEAVDVSTLLPAGPQRGNMSLYVQDYMDRSALALMLDVVDTLVARNFGVHTAACTTTLPTCATPNPSCTCAGGHAYMNDHTPNVGTCYFSKTSPPDVTASLNGAKQQAQQALSSITAQLAMPLVQHSEVMGLSLTVADLIFKATSATCTATGSLTVPHSYTEQTSCDGADCVNVNTSNQACGSQTWPSGVQQC